MPVKPHVPVLPNIKGCRTNELHLFINCCAASAGGGLTYLRNVAPHLSRRGDVKATIAVSERMVSELPTYRHISWLPVKETSSVARRFWGEQTMLPKLIRRAGADVLISAGNFALRNSPVPQILLSGNALYLSSEFRRDLFGRREFGLLIDTVLKAYFAKRSLHWANCTVAPSGVFAAMLRQRSGADVRFIHHGFDHRRFIEHAEPLSDEVQRKLAAGESSLRLLVVSHYNYYRDFETLFRAVPMVKEAIPERDIKLFLTCTLDKKDGAYNPQAAARLIRELHIENSVVQLGPVAHSALANLYRRCEIYVSPAYAETFAFPLVEAMACDLPVLASDIAVHREVCGSAAEYFPAFSATDLASQIVTLANRPDFRQRMRSAGRERSEDFSWSKHVEELLQVARKIRSRRNGLATLSESDGEHEPVAAAS